MFQFLGMSGFWFVTYGALVINRKMLFWVVCILFKFDFFTEPQICIPMSRLVICRSSSYRLSFVWSVSFAIEWRNYLSSRRRLLSFIFVLSMWSGQISFLSKCTPRYLVVFQVDIRMLLLRLILFVADFLFQCKSGYGMIYFRLFFFSISDISDTVA